MHSALQYQSRFGNGLFSQLAAPPSLFVPIPRHVAKPGMAREVMPSAPTPRKHAQGLTLIFCVALIWVGSAELIQYIFGESSFDKPFFLTYFSTALFSVYLLGFAFRPSWRDLLFAPDAVLNSTASGSAVYAELADIESDEEDVLSTATANPARERADADSRPGSREVRYEVLSAGQVRTISIILAPLFFSSNYFFNLGLDGTSVASSSTISTLSSLFSLLLGAFAGVERFSIPKLVSAATTIAGVAIISRNDQKTGGHDSFFGDAVSVFSAFLYGLYAIMLKKHLPSEEMASMAMMFGYLGAFVALTGWPFLIILNIMRLEVFTFPDLRVFGLLLLNALVGTVVSDYLWARSVALTTPVIATLALSLTLPLSLVFDYFLRSVHFALPYLVGVFLVLTGFIGANVDEALSARA